MSQSSKSEATFITNFGSVGVEKMPCDRCGRMLSYHWCDGRTAEVQCLDCDHLTYRKIMAEKAKKSK